MKSTSIFGGDASVHICGSSGIELSDVSKLSISHFYGRKLNNFLEYILMMKEVSKIEQLKAIIQKQPKNEILWYNLAAQYWIHRQYKQTISACQQAIKLKPDSAKYQIVLANAYNRDEQFQEGIKHALEIIRLDPDNHEGYSILGNAYQGTKQFDEAIEAYNKSLQKKADNYIAYRGLGMTYYAKKQFQKAISAFKEAVKYKPTQPQAYFLVGYAYSANHQIDEAISAYKQAIKYKQDYDQAYNLLGLALVANNQVMEGISALKSAIKYKPDFYVAYSNLGYALLINNQFDEAISVLQQVIKHKPNLYEAYNNLGAAYKKKNRMGQAISTLKQAIKLRQDLDPPYNNLGCIYHGEKKFKQALEYFNKALQLKPANPQYLAEKISLLYEMGMKNEAFDLFNQLTYAMDINDKKSLLRLKKEYQITQTSINSIIAFIKHFDRLKKMMKQTVVLGQGTGITDEVAKLIFSDLKNIKEQSNTKKQDFQDKFQAQMKELQKKIQAQEKQLAQLNEHTGLNTFKKFKQLTKKYPQKADYFQELVYRLTITIKAYQLLETGMVQRGGDEPIQSKTAVVASFLQKGLSLAEKIPLIESVASVVKGVCEFYLGLEAQYITEAVVSKFKGLDDQKISILIKGMAIQLGEFPNFDKLLTQEGKQLYWFEKVAQYYKKGESIVNDLKDEAVARITDIKGAEISENENLAREHCAELLTTLIMKKNQAKIHVSGEDFLIETAKIFFNQKTKQLSERPQKQCKERSEPPKEKKKAGAISCFGGESECTLM